MIHLTQGDILQVQAEAIVNTVNCVGIMGRGIALQFRKTYPENFKHYKKVCDRQELHLGQMLVFETGSLTLPRFIINFPTKGHWKAKSKIQDIKDGLKTLVTAVVQHNIKSIAIPPLGCGLGGLNWQEVRPIIEAAFAPLQDVNVILYEPSKEQEKAKRINAENVPAMTVGRATLLSLMQRYLLAAMDPIVSLLEIHKMMYFMQEAGENLRLIYKKANYGPFAENLRHVLRHIEGHFITGYDDSDDKPEKQIQLLPQVVDKADYFLSNLPETLQRFDRVVDLIEGFETPYGMELLTTVHWVATRENATSVDEAIVKMRKWNDRKKMFKSDEVQVAWEALSQKNWLHAISRVP